MAVEAERLRIAVFTETFLPRIDGIVTRLCHTLRHLHRAGHSVLVIAPSGVDEFEGTHVHGVPGFPFPLYPDLKLSIPRPSIGKTLHAFRPDLLHALNPAMLGNSSFFYSAMRRIPLVVSYHTHLPKYLHYYGLGALEGLTWWGLRESYNRADLTLCTSRAMQTELLDHGIRRVQVWQRAVDTELFHPERASQDMRERLTEGHPDEKLLLYVGRLSAEKNIEQCRFVLETLPGVRLALVGDGPHRHKLEQYFAGTPTYFAGFLKGSELASAFASADVFFLPSKTETLGLVLMEAMAAGCAVVTPRAGGTSDIVQDRVTGHLYDPKDGPLEVIRKLLFDSDHREAMRLRARMDAEQWNWTAATNQLEVFYRDLLSREQRLPEQVAQLRARGADGDHICESLQISKATLRRHKGARSPAYV